MKALNISGGGTKIVGQFGALEVLAEAGWRPDVITGISAGAILSLFVAMDALPGLRQLFLNLRPGDFFRRSPVTKKGRVSLSAVWRLLTLRKSLGDFSRLTELLREHIPVDDFERWKGSEGATEVYVGSVSYTTGERRYWFLNEMGYDEAMLAITASSSIPVFCEPVRMLHPETGRWHHHVDGGARDYIGSAHVIEKYGKKIKEMINVFSKPLDNRIFKFDHTRTKSIISIFIATLSVMQTEVSKSDETIIELMAKKHGIKSRNIYIPAILRHGYDTDPTRIGKIYKAGRKAMSDLLDGGQEEIRGGEEAMSDPSDEG